MVINPRSKCEALRLCVHVMFLYYYYEVTLDPYWKLGGVQLLKNVEYSLGIYVFVYKLNFCKTKLLRVFKFGKVGELPP